MEDKEKITLLLYELNGSYGEKALEELIKIYYYPLKRYLSIFLKDRRIVKEVLSDVFIAVWKNRDKIIYPYSFNTYFIV
ncbi:MAG: hypothetical protein LUE26_09360 [Alistipes sp.]|nr:hypothetical protein [Alistipes sp.]